MTMQTLQLQRAVVYRCPPLKVDVTELPYQRGSEAPPVALENIFDSVDVHLTRVESVEADQEGDVQVDHVDTHG